MKNTSYFAFWLKELQAHIESLLHLQADRAYCVWIGENISNQGRPDATTPIGQDTEQKPRWSR